MKNKKIKKIITIIILCIIILQCIPISTQASDVLGELGELEQYGKLQGDSENFKTKAGIFIGIFQVAGSVIAVISLVGMGVFYMFGSIGEKAAYKKTLRPYVIGAFMVFGVSNLTALLYEVVVNLFD